MNTIRLYGPLAKFIGRKTFEVEISTAAESIRFLEATFPQVKRHMRDQWYTIAVGRHRLGINELHHPIGSQEVRIIPVFCGAITGKEASNLLNMGARILGVPDTSYKPETTSSSSGGGGRFNFGAFIGSLISDIANIAPLLAVGVAITYAGYALSKPAPQVGVSPTPNRPLAASDPRANFSFSGIQNTGRAGLPVPIVYGEIVTGSVVISAGIDTVQGKG